MLQTMEKVAFIQEMIMPGTDLTWLKLAAVVTVGFAAGFVNMFAGGGSSVTLPMLMFLGLPPSVANATNRVTILMQSIAGAGTFMKNKAMPVSGGWRMLVPSAAGALTGAFLALKADESFLKDFITGLMIAMLALVIFNPQAWIRKKSAPEIPRPGFLQYLLFFLIGIYGGFLQVGVGYLLLAGLVVGCKLDILGANAMKVVIILVYTVIAVAVFQAGSHIEWGIGLLMGVGSMAGAWAGAHFTLRGSATLIRYFLMAALTAMILKLLGLF